MFSLLVLITRGLDLYFAGKPLALPLLCLVFRVQFLNIVGVFNGEGPPVPIPNTEVKLTSADNTCLETDWKDRSTPTQRVWRKSSPLNFASLAQQVEHAAVNRRVVGSNPTGGATETVLPSRYRDGNIFSEILTVSSVGSATGS